MEDGLCRDAACRVSAGSDQFSLFVLSLWSSSGIFWVQPGCRHDGASQLFGGNGKSFGWHLAGDIFLGGGGDEAIASSDYGQQVLRLVGVVREGAADLADGSIDSLFDVDEDVFTPQLAGDLLARYQLAPLLYHEHEQLQRQALEPNRAATAAELQAIIIQLEIVEADFFIRQHTTTKLPVANPLLSPAAAAGLWSASTRGASRTPPRTS